MSNRIHSAAHLLAIALTLLSLPGCGKIKEMIGQGAGSSKAKEELPPGPVVTFKGGKVALDGEPTDKEPVELDRLRKIDGLFDALKAKREEWKSTHPDRAFPGRAVLRPSPKTPLVTVLSAFQSCVYAGYPKLSFETPSGFIPMHGIIPKVPMMGAEWKEQAPLPRELRINLTKDEVSLTVVHGYLLLSDQKLPRPDDLKKGLKEIIQKKLAELGKGTRADITLYVEKELPLADLQNALAGILKGGVGPSTPLYLSVVPQLRAKHMPNPVLNREDNPLGRLEEPAQPENADSPRKKSQLFHYHIHAIFPWLRDCYEGGLAKDIKLDGTLELRLTIGQEGKVAEIRSEGDVTDKDVIECIEKEVRATTFRGLEDIQIHYPLMLLPHPEGPAKPPSAGPRLDQGDDSVAGRLPPELIQRIVRQNFGRFRLCYENGLRNNPNLKGRVKVRFIIGRDGKVTNVSGGGDLPDAEVVSCVTRAFYGLQFPEPEGGIVTVSYPIVFEPS